MIEKEKNENNLKKEKNEETDLVIKEGTEKEKQKTNEEIAKAKLKEEKKKKESICVTDCLTCKEEQAKSEEFKNLLKITMADFDNYRKRSLNLLKDAKIEGEIGVVQIFLPTLDAFSKAKEMTEDKQHLIGIEMLEKEIKNALKKIGVKEIHCVGEKFDPLLHSAISISHNNDLEDDIITHVIQAGYTYKEKIIRYAQVIINKKNTKK